MKKKKNSIEIFILIILVILILIGLVIFFLTRKPKVTYEYYINNNKSNIAGNNISNYECNNGTTLNIDEDNNTYSISSITKNSLCKIYYEDTAGEQIINLTSGLDTLEEKNKTYIDDASILRYYGENPLNYVYFNCDSDTDTNTCEIWRIVSINKVSDVTKKNKYNLKIVKDTPLKAIDTTTKNEITNFEWNNNRDFNIIESSIYKLLNEAYYNASSNYTYTNKDNKTITLDFSNSGLKNDNVRKMVLSNTWRINANTDNNQTITNWYSDTTSGNMANFKIGLISISDYVLALKDNCKDIKINEFATCDSKSYLTKENGFFVLDSYQEKEGFVYRIAGNNAINAIYPTATYNIYPSLYLNEDVKIVSGDGSISNPYHLG